MSRITFSVAASRFLFVCFFSVFSVFSAAVMAANIDFTNANIWGSSGIAGGANGKTVYSTTDNQITIGLTTTLDLSGNLIASPRNLTTNEGMGEIGGCQAANSNVGAGLSCGGDGIGVGNDEISRIASGEVLTLTFESSAVNVNSISFLDLFIENNDGSGELAKFKFYDVVGDLITSESALALYNPGVNGGFKDWVANPAVLNVKSIQFWAPNDGVTDFALAAINVTAVPLPAAILLFASAILGLFGIGRVKKDSVKL